MNDVLVLLLVLIFILSYSALVVLLATFLRGLTQRGRQTLVDSPLRTIVTGVVGWAVFGTLAAWLYSRAHVDGLPETGMVSAYFIAACVAVIVPSLICLFGAPGLYTHIGSRIAALCTRETSDLWCVVVGSVVALTASMFPFVGWFLIMPLLLAAEFGAGFRSLFR